MSQYSDSPRRSSRSQGNGHSGRSTPGDSYSDRFRVDAPGEHPARQYSSSNGRPTTSVRLVSMIERACRPSLMEPDLALNLEIADVINQKKGTAPRDAALAIVGLINNRNPHIAILALACLDICVKNCGYPFHLQISRKEFLNELVSRFPEKPPIALSRPQMLILEAIEEWRQTLCRTSKYKDDLGYIRDMHRLLSYKGYMFPEISRDDAAVLNPTETLKSAAELEQEERDAQSAKLQELIRRGTPADLQEANRLMSIMAGFKESKTNYRAKAAKELEKLRRKAEILEEMLLHASPDDSQTQNDNDDVFQDIVSALKTAAPKIQKMIDEESGEDQEAVVKLLALNDYIHTLLERYRLLKAKDFEGAKNVQIATMPGSDERRRPNTSSKSAIMESLIEIDDDNDLTTSGAQEFGGSAPSSAAAAPVKPTSSSQNIDLLSSLEGLSFSDVKPASPMPALSSLGGISLSSGPASPHSGASGSASPSLSQFQSNTSSSNKPTDEWDIFMSGSNSTPTSPSKEIVVWNKPQDLKIVFTAKRDSPQQISIDASYSNQNFSQSISELNFQLAAPKSQKLRLEPQTGSTIGFGQSNGITQKSYVELPAGVPLKLRWRVSYKLGSKDLSADGTIEGGEI